MASPDKLESKRSIKGPGRKTEWEARYSVSLKRPNKFAVLVADSPWLGKSYVSDGNMLSRYSPYGQSYEAADAPRNLAQFLSRKYDGPRPGPLEESFLWVLAPDPDQELRHLALVESDAQIKDLGLEDIEGTQCHVVQLTNEYRQMLLWIQIGQQPLPRRFEDHPSEQRRKTVGLESDLVASFTNWDLDLDLPDEEFRFAPPPDWKRVDKGFSEFPG